MKPIGTWILIANGSSAHMAEHTGPGRGLSMLAHKWSAEPETEHADRPGRSFKRVGPTRHGFEPHGAGNEQHEAFARLLAENIDDAGIAALREAQAALDRGQASKQAGRRLEADLAFHRLIVELCGNRPLLEAYAQIANKLRWIYATSEALSPERIDLNDWHAPLANAICAGKAKQAAEIAHRMCMASLDDDLRDRRAVARHVEAAGS